MVLPRRRRARRARRRVRVVAYRRGGVHRPPCHLAGDLGGRSIGLLLSPRMRLKGERGHAQHPLVVRAAERVRRLHCRRGRRRRPRGGAVWGAMPTGGSVRFAVGTRRLDHPHRVGRRGMAGRRPGGHGGGMPPHALAVCTSLQVDTIAPPHDLLREEHAARVYKAAAAYAPGESKGAAWARGLGVSRRLRHSALSGDRRRREGGGARGGPATFGVAGGGRGCGAEEIKQRIGRGMTGRARTGRRLSGKGSMLGAG
jgi:hypothetical protein